MDLWFSERHTKNIKFSMRVDQQLFSDRSEYQRIDIFKTLEFGKVLVLDDVVMLTEKDEFIYHEMITHVALATNPLDKKGISYRCGRWWNSFTID